MNYSVNNTKTISIYFHLNLSVIFKYFERLKDFQNKSENNKRKVLVNCRLPQIGKFRVAIDNVLSGNIWKSLLPNPYSVNFNQFSHTK